MVAGDIITTEFIELAVVANFITWYFTPFDQPRAWLTDKWVRLCVKWNQFWLVDIIKPLSCVKCFAFWGGLIYTQSFISAIIISMIALVIKNILEYGTKQELE
tara:strand:+ start:1780 stop:2088 length:309 start_codon:yes stop_codon:yes gene_type:complete